MDPPRNNSNSISAEDLYGVVPESPADVLWVTEGVNIDGFTPRMARFKSKAKDACRFGVVIRRSRKEEARACSSSPVPKYREDRVIREWEALIPFKSVPRYSEGALKG